MADLDIFNKIFNFFAVDDEICTRIRFVPKSKAEETVDAIWRMDRDSAIYLAEHLDEFKGKRFKMYECSKCGASYLKDVHHDCNNTIDFNCKKRKIV